MSDCPFPNIQIVCKFLVDEFLAFLLAHIDILTERTDGKESPEAVSWFGADEWTDVGSSRITVCKLQNTNITPTGYHKLLHFTRVVLVSTEKVLDFFVGLDLFAGLIVQLFPLFR
jgi:hypothetical protein